MKVRPGTPRDTPRDAALERLISRARLALIWERVWPPLAAAGSVIVLFLALSWFNVWSAVPPWGRAAGMIMLAGLAFLALAPLARITIPDRSRVLARIDAASRLGHRPATTIDDHLSGGGEDPVTRAFWNVHRDRARRNAERLKAGAPRPNLAARDPWALRFAVLLMALVAAIIAGQDRERRLLTAFDWTSPVAAPPPPRLDAWVTPPPYTGRAPIFLTNPTETPVDTLSLPEDSRVVVRSSSGDVSVTSGGGLIVEQQPDADTAQDAVHEWRFQLTADATLDVTAGSRAAQRWRFQAIPDTAPAISFTSPPEVSEGGDVTLRYRITDDYGAREAWARVTPRDQALNASPLVDAPEMRLVLPPRRGRDTAASTHDVQAHPWAGGAVSITLEVRDDAGNTGMSAAMNMTLPQRPFRDPVARALVEQRRVLAMDTGRRNSVERALDNLTLYPEHHTPRAATYLTLRSSYWRLREASGTDELRDVLDHLWKIAVWLEDGEAGDLMRDLQAARDALREALENGASDEEIARLMQQLRETMQQFLAEMARRAQNAERTPGQMPPNTQMVRPQDLMDMLDRMERMAREGSRDAAEDLLSQLDQILQGLDPSMAMPMDPMSEEMARMLDELGQMIREQNELRDRTFQQGQQQEGEENGQGQSDMQGLAQDQQSLRERLEALMKQLQEQGLDGGEALGEAGKAMGEAQGQLGQQDTEGALESQGDALEALRRGAQGIADQMFGDGDQPGQNGGPGRPAGQRGNDERVDPLGRPTRTRRYDPGTSVQVPGEIDAQRARRVLEELRRRLSDPSRPALELDYLERLIEP